MTMGISIGISSMKRISLEATKTRMSHVKEALVHYLRQNNRLPCPNAYSSTGFSGKEDPPSGGTCTNSVGVLPYITLGLDRTEVVDGWDNLFTYRVSDGSSTSTNNPGLGIIGSGIGRCLNRNTWTTAAILNQQMSGLNQKMDGEILITKGGIHKSDCVVLVVVSHGPNGKGAYTVDGYQNDSVGAGTDEITNIPPGGPSSGWTYADGDYSGTYDDLLVSMTASDLLAPLVKDGSVKSDAGMRDQVLQQLARIRDAIFVYMVNKTGYAIGAAACPIPATWLTGISYVVGDKVIPSVPNGYAYSATSAGTSGAGPSFWLAQLGTIVSDGAVSWKTISLNRFNIHNLPYEADPASALPGPLVEVRSPPPSRADPTEGYVPYTTLGSLTLSDVTDPWGSQIRYYVNSACAADGTETSAPVTDGLHFGTSPVCSGGRIAFRLISGGSDGFLAANYSGGLDATTCNSTDICIDVTVNELLSKMASSGIPVDTFNGCP